MPSWTNYKFWRSYYRKMDNAKLIKSVNDHKKDPSFYRKTVLPKAARDELAARKKAGKIRQNAGTKKRRSNRGFFF